MEIQTIKIGKLRPHPQNPRTHPDSAIDKLVKSLNEFGFTNPILVSKDNYILAGHARLKAAQKAGLKEVPIIRLPLKGNKALAYMIADNRLQDETDWDIPMLKDLLEILDTGELDLEVTGFDLKGIEDLMTQFHPTDDDLPTKLLPPELEGEDTRGRYFLLVYKDEEERLIWLKRLGLENLPENRRIIKLEDIE